MIFADLKSTVPSSTSSARRRPHSIGCSRIARSCLPSGTVVNLTATANTNYAFSYWTGNVANATSASTTVTMSAPKSVSANFIAAPNISAFASL